MAAAAAVQLGIDGEIYRNTGSFGSPTWVAGGLVKSVKSSAKWNKSDASIRATRAVLNAKTQMNMTGSLMVRADPADAWYQALFDASMADSASAIDLLVLDGPITQEGCKGVRGYMNLYYDQDQEIDNVIYTTFEYDPAWNAGGYPSKVIVGSGSALTLTQY